MSLGVLDTALTWREVPQEEIGDVHARSATFKVPTPHGPVEFFVSGELRGIRGYDGRALDVSFGKGTGSGDSRIRRIRSRWYNYQRRHPRRRSMVRYLERARRTDDLTYYMRFMAARNHVPAKAFTIIATVADIIQTWIVANGVRYVVYAPSDETRGRLYNTMVRMLAPRAKLVNKPEDLLDLHIWRVR